MTRLDDDWPGRYPGSRDPGWAQTSTATASILHLTLTLTLTHTAPKRAVNCWTRQAGGASFWF